MFKKRFTVYVFCLIFTVLFFSGCDKTESTVAVPSSSEEVKTDLNIEADIDMTGFSATAAYSEVSNILNSPSDYKGKTVKISGTFSAIYENVENNDLIFLCNILDATACCSQGLEFVPKDNLNFPEDYPMEGDRVTVVGIPEIYERDGVTRVHLENAEMIF